MKKIIYLVVFMIALSCNTKPSATNQSPDSSTVTQNEDEMRADTLGRLKLAQDIDLSRLKSIKRDKKLGRSPIVGGEPTDIESVPWQVLLQFGGDDICGGSIIADRWIVTACHCVSFIKDPKHLVVFAGLTDKTTGKPNAQMMRVVEIIKHPGYNEANEISAYNNDIALLRLEKSIAFSASARPIRWATQTDENAGITAAGKRVKVSGWGLTTENGVPASSLRSVVIDIMANTTASGQYSSPYTVTQNMLAAGNPQGGEDACQGDSGGPLAVDFDSANPVLVGIVSYGEGCGRRDYAGIYTRVSKYDSWIRENASGILASRMRSDFLADKGGK